MGTKMKLRVAFSVILVLLLAAGGLYWHFGVRARTPEHSLECIRAALEKRDKSDFSRYVDLDRLLDTSYDGFVDGMLDSEISLPAEAKPAVGSFTQMMKAPIIASFKTEVEQYVSTGSWVKEGDGESVSEADELVRRSGIQQTEIRQVEEIDTEEDHAVAHIRVYQQEAAQDFVFEAVMRKNDKGDWRLEEIRNFRDFIIMVGEARRAKLYKYLDTTAEIMERHDRSIREAELRYGDLLSTGSLGNQEIRDSIKSLMQDVIYKDWDARKQELFSVDVPESARTLQHVRLRICDLHMEYAKGYATWMSDKKAVTIREADAKLKEAKTLEQEAKAMVRHMSSARE